MANSDIIRNNISDYYTSIPYDENASEYISSVLSNGTWLDIDYNSTVHVYEHTRRNLVMGMYYKKTPSTVLLNKITVSVNYMFDNIFNKINFWNTEENWWYRDIGVPYYTYGELFIILYGNLSSSLKTKFQNYLLNYAAPIKNDTVYTGQNAIWGAVVRLIYGSIYNSQTHINRAIAIMNQMIVVVSFGEGLQPDGSFHQHGDVLYTGGYGQSFLGECLKFVEFLGGTTLGIQSEKMDVLANYFIKYLWILHKGIEDAAASGRDFSRPFFYSETGRNTSMIALAILYKRYSGGFRTSLLGHGKWAIQENRILDSVYEYFLPTLNTISSNQTIITTPLYGHIHFPYSDYTVHRREKGIVSLKMISNRTQTMEMVNGEGEKGWHMTDGMITRHKPNIDWRMDDVLPVLNWNLLSGTTTSNISLPINQSKYGINQHCGNANNGDNGISAMDFISPDYDLRAKKSWFFFDNEVICLGSDIMGSVSNVVTVVEQLPLNNLLSSVSSSGNARKIENNCYYFFDSVSGILFDKKSQSGRWSDIGRKDTLSPLYDYLHTKPVCTITIPHGSNPQQGEYSYMMFVDGDISIANAKTIGDAYKVISNNSVLHYVKNEEKDVDGLVFWQAGNSSVVNADKPCIVLVQGVPIGKQISVSDLTHESTTIKLSLRGRFNTNNFDIQNASYDAYSDRTVFTVNVANGDSKTFTMVSSPVQMVTFPIAIKDINP